MKQERWCKMTARMGTTLSGVFSIVSSHMYLMFEHKHLSHANCTNLQKPNDTMFKFFICWSFRIVLFQSLITMLASFLLLYSVYAQIYRGLIVYAVWIFCYELTNFVVEISKNDLCMEEVRIMSWFGWVSRSVMHCFWMLYVVPYAYVIYKSQKQGNILAYNRRASTGSSDAPRRKSRILNFVHHHWD
uniref:transmembrane protein 217 n=1 Tax=Jaculus jaculus TaxID=51337 RepID=UPI00033341F4|nr:transmembrane protein 217 [Jaculus jaculus]